MKIIKNLSMAFLSLILSFMLIAGLIYGSIKIYQSLYTYEYNTIETEVTNKIIDTDEVFNKEYSHYRLETEQGLILIPRSKYDSFSVGDKVHLREIKTINKITKKVVKISYVYIDNYN